MTRSTIIFRFLFCIVIFCCSISDGSCQYFQQDLNYKIEAKLDTANHTLSATCIIHYENKSKHALDTFFIHLWANAFSDKLSAYTDQAIRLNDLEFYFADEKDMGGYENLYVSIDGKRMQLYSWQGNPDVVYFLFPKPLAPKESFSLYTSYDLKLPRYFSRMGHKTHDDYLTYWYPTPAVYDSLGWHPMPYLNMGETYTEYGKYDIKMEIPFEHVIASSPSLTKGTAKHFKSLNRYLDFAIIGSNNKPVYESEIPKKEANLLQLKVMSRYPERAESIKQYLIKALPYYEEKIGPFPHRALSVIDMGFKNQSGMEYPGLITVSGSDNENSDLEYYVVHELLHQWFYSSLGFNQRDYPWLDEGLATYYQQRYYKEVKNADHYNDKFSFAMQNGQLRPLLHNFAIGQARRCYHQPLNTPADEIAPVNYGINSYEIPARMYAYLEDYLGTSKFDEVIQFFASYYRQNHPAPHNLREAFENRIENEDLEWFFDQLINEDWTYDYGISSFSDGQVTVEHIAGSSPPYKLTMYNDEGQEKAIWVDGHTGNKSISVENGWTSFAIDAEENSMDSNASNNYHNVSRPIKIIPGMKMDAAKNREIYAIPTVSYNTSDGGQVGVALYNSTFPSKRLKWAISPAYGIKSKKLVGEGWVSYDQYLTGNKNRKLQYKVNFKSYDYRYSETLEQSLRYARLSPHVSFHFGHKASEQKYSKVYFKPIFLDEEYFQFEDEQVSIRHRSSRIFRLGYEHYNFWNLGPSDYAIQLEYQPYKNTFGEQHDYLKLSASVNKSFVYAPERSVDFRIWGGYFLKNSNRQSSNFDGSITRGSMALIHQGFNDYAYDDYFFNRTNQDVSFENQVSNLGGGFKTPFGSQYSIGQSNDLAFAINFKSDLPFPTPKFLPLKVFLDVGYYTSKGTNLDPLTGRNLYSGGVMLEYGEGLLSIHLPLFANEDINEIYDTEGVGLLGKISFKLDLVRFNPWDIAEDYRF